MSEVETYRQYIKKTTEPLDLTLSLSAIQWHGSYGGYLYNYYNDVTVKVKGEPFISATGIKSGPNTQSAKIGEGKFKAELNDIIQIDVSIVAKYGLVSISSMNGGSANESYTPRQLKSGVTIDVKGDGFNNKATFSLSGFPDEPQLPDWKSQ